MHRVIKIFDICKDIVLRLGSGHVGLQVNELSFQVAEKVFRNHVVIWIALAGILCRIPRAPDGFCSL